MNSDYDKIFNSISCHIMRKLSLINMTVVPLNLTKNTITRITSKAIMLVFEMKFHIPSVESLHSLSDDVTADTALHVQQLEDCLRALTLQMVYMKAVSLRHTMILSHW